MLENTDKGKIMDNNCSNNGEGIYLYNACNNNTILNNRVDSNTNGIMVDHYSDNNIISGNIAEYNSHGIYIYRYCQGNVISGNTLRYNTLRGIYLNVYCSNNYILENTANENDIDGMWLRDHCNNNNVSGNTANENIERGITLSKDCVNNIISGNKVKSNNYYGILLSNDCNDNTISNNIAKDNNPGGIYLWQYCNDNIVSGNVLKDNDEFGINFYRSSNNIISGNLIQNNSKYGTFLDGDCNNNLFYLNGFIKNENHSRDEGNNQWDNGNFGNYWDNYSGYDLLPIDGIGDIPHNIPVNKSDTKPLMELCWDTPPQIPLWYPMPNLKISHFSSVVSYKSESFVLDFSICNDGIWRADGVIIIVRCEILDLTLFNNTNSPLTLEVDETEYIAVNIPPLGQTGTFSLDLIIDPYNNIDETFSLKDGSVRINAEADNSQTADLTILSGILNIVFTSQVFTNDEFDIRFFIYDETGQSIDFATVQLWWDGVEVSGDVQNIGNGFYSISLDPITVAPGEDPILLSMIISANGYEDTNFETYLAVDPETLDKGVNGEFPLIMVIIISVVGGIVVVGVALVILRKRKGPS
jgi:parallel beta-helix repeat protein